MDAALIASILVFTVSAGVTVIAWIIFSKIDDAIDMPSIITVLVIVVLTTMTIAAMASPFVVHYAMQPKVTHTDCLVSSHDTQTNTTTTMVQSGKVMVPTTQTTTTTSAITSCGTFSDDDRRLQVGQRYTIITRDGLLVRFVAQ